jgi:alkaline phosphatase D
MEILDAGRAYNGGRPPQSIRYGGNDIPNFCNDQPAQTILGAEQKAWFLDQLRMSTATWKIWGSTTATLDVRADPQNLPPGITTPWPGGGFAGLGGGDFSTAYTERAEIYDFVREHGIVGFATVAGDRHSFWAGLAAKALPPAAFEPVGVAFVTGSISAPGVLEAVEHRLPRAHPLRALFVGQAPTDATPQATINMLFRHGVCSCLAYAASGDMRKARASSNPDLSPHVSFVDMGGHGYAVVRADGNKLETEFVCIPRPVERSDRADGGPITYRVRYGTRRWQKGEVPVLVGRVLEGDPKFSL